MSTLTDWLDQDDTPPAPAQNSGPRPEPGPAPSTTAAATDAAPVEDPDTESLRERIVATLREIYDPEIPVNIYDLNLIYAIKIGDQSGEEREIDIDMTLTAPGCPVADTFPGEVESRVREVDGVSDVRVELVWDPPWGMEMMSDEVKLQLGML
jgi:FeS assembly SUF system protein